MSYTLLGLSGSLRRDATNRKLLAEAARLSGASRYVTGDLNLPLYDGDLEQAEGIPAAVQSLADQIGAADAVIISTPEYNKGPSGVLKNAFDWVSRTKGNPWLEKPVAVMSASSGRAGGERAQMILRSYLIPFQPRLLTGPEVHLAASSQAFGENGQLVGEIYIKTLQALMEKLTTAVAGGKGR